MRRLLITSLAALALGLCGAAAAQAATVADPTGDNCAGGPCGPDLTGASTRVDPDGTARLGVTRASSVCNTISYPSTEVQPSFQFLASGATSRDDTGSYRGFVWAVSTTSDFMFTPAGGGANVPLASTVTAGSVEVVLPASVVAAMGGLPLKLFVTNSCREFPFEPITASKDLVPDSGLLALEADAAAGPQPQPSPQPGTDACTNLPGAQAGVPAGYAAVGGRCLRTLFTGTARRDRLVGNSLANIMRGGAGNDVLIGKAGADRLFGGPGRDRLVGGPGRDRLIGGPGFDTCIADARDIVRGCERTIRT